MPTRIPRWMPVLALLLVALLALPLLSASHAAAQAQTLSPFEQEVFNLVNQRRAENGLPSLTLDWRLVQAARNHNAAMIQANEFSHLVSGELPLCTGGLDNDRYDVVGYPWTSCAENIAGGQSTPEEVMTAWMGSSGHRANILSSGYRDFGIGYTAGGSWGHYWTQTFGTRDDSPPPPPAPTATPVPSPTPVGTTATFLDVPTTDWAWRYVESIYAARITVGCSTSPALYCPGGPVTREQMAVFLVRARYGGMSSPPAAVGLFTDVAKSYWAAPWIERAYLDGITTPCTTAPLQYCALDRVPRSLMARWLLRARYGSLYQPPPARGLFGDVPLTHPDAAWIEKLYADGITTGCSVSPLMYCPNGSVTRAEMAAFLTRTFNLPLP